MSEDRQLILIADDDEMFRLLVRSTLEQAGYVVVEAENGESAVRKFRALTPQLMLLDVMMPEMNGFEVCREIRQSPKGLNVPIVMTTSLDDLESIRQAYQMGATDFITKPVDWQMLTMRVNFLIRANHKIVQTLQRSVHTLSEKKASEVNTSFASSIDQLEHQLGPQLLKDLLNVIDDSIRELDMDEPGLTKRTPQPASKTPSRTGIDETVLLQLRLQEMQMQTEFVNRYLQEIAADLTQALIQFKQADAAQDVFLVVQGFNRIKMHADYIGAQDLSRLCESVLMAENQDVAATFKSKCLELQPTLEDVLAYIQQELEDKELHFEEGLA